MESEKMVYIYHFEEHYEHLPVPILAIDEKGVITYSNQFNADLFSLDKKKLIGKSVFQFISLEDEKIIKKEIKSLFTRRNKKSNFEIRILEKNKKIRWVKVIACFMSNEQDVLLVTLQDITGEKHALSLIQMKKQVTEMIVKKRPLIDILNFISVHIEPFFQNPTFGSIFMLDEKGETINQVITPRLTNEYNESLLGLKIGPRVGSSGTAIYRRENVFTEDIATDPLWDDYRHLLKEFRTRSAWSVPIFIDGRVIGAFSLYHLQPITPNSFEITLIETCAHLVGLTVECCRVQEKAIQESQRAFKVLLNSLTDLVVFIDNEGKWIEVNDTVSQKLGVINDDYKEKTTSQISLISSDELKEFFHKVSLLEEDSCKTNETIIKELTISSALLDPIEVEIRLFPISDGDGGRNGTVLLGRVITERKRMALMLEESEQRFRSLFEHNPDSIYCIGLDGKFLDVNHQIETLLGYNKNEYLGSFSFSVHQKYLEHTTKSFLNSTQGQTQNFESVFIHKNGHYVDVSITNFPLIVKGEIKGVFSVVKDITYEKKVNEELLETKERLESFVTNSSDCIKIFDLEGTLLKTNPALKNIYGYELDEVIGQNFFLTKTEDFSAVFDKIKAGEEVIGVEVEELSKDQRTLHISKTYSPIRDGKGNIVGISSICRDVTMSKETEELLKRSDKLSVVGQLAAGVAHEIRNPLTSIKGFVQLFQDKINPEYVELMLSELKRIEDIVTEFLSLAKPQPNHFVEANLLTIVQNTLSVIQTQAIMNQVDIHTHCDDFAPIIVCDQNKIKQLLLNVLKNAIEAMPSGGEINLIIRKLKDQILLRIVDTGCGIPADRIQKLGEPFFSNKEKGTGLGLMMCFKIVEAHKGKMTFNSEDGSGTTVDISLPI
jgi:two-component system sporulation sensor kinase A